MPVHIPSAIDAKASLAELAKAADKLQSHTLRQKVEWLRTHRSPDQLQQMQSEAITELYDAVRQIQTAIWPLLSMLPDVSGVRDAAQSSSSSLSQAAIFARTRKP